MSEAKVAFLRDRGVISVSGEDARKLLQGIITNDMDRLDTQPAMLAGLLSPQGKVLFDFFVVKVDGGYLLDVDTDLVESLVKRLVMYRLRAKASIEDLSGDRAVAACWPRGDGFSITPKAIVFPDPRSSELGSRCIFHSRDLERGLVRDGAETVTAMRYLAHRIALGIPEGGKDYDFGDAFPHEANFDLLHGVDFEKGCYVGQEIVSRMQHRATVRKRIVCVSGTTDLPSSRAGIRAGEAVIGKLGSVAGARGLAMLRLDRAIEAVDKGEPITADGITLIVDTEALARHRAAMAEKASHT